jgi:hypothetical protein
MQIRRRCLTPSKMIHQKRLRNSRFQTQPRVRNMDESYPKRQAFFAHKFIRTLARSCAANVIGPEACWLLTIIAMTEDAKQYSGPVTFYGDILASQCGFSTRVMQRARRNAVEAGWLHYVPGTNRRAASYWVTMPSGEAAKINKQTHDDNEFVGEFDNRTVSEPSLSGVRTVPELSKNRSSIANLATERCSNGVRTVFEPGPLLSYSYSYLPKEEEAAPAEVKTEPTPTAEPPRLDPAQELPDPFDPPLQSPTHPESIAADANLTHVIFPTADGESYDFTESDRQKFSKTYPGVDVLAEVRKSLIWLEAEGLRDFKAMPRFIANWFSFGHERGKLAKIPSNGPVVGPPVRPNRLQDWRNVPPAPPMVFQPIRPAVAKGGAK